MSFENPAFDKDDYDDDIDERMPMVPDDVDQRIISNQNDSIAEGNSNRILLTARNKNS